MSSKAENFLDDETLEKLINADWPAILLRMIKYAEAKLKKFEALGITNLEHEDLVQEAIKRIFEARRRWNQEVYPDLESFLKSVIKSLASHATEPYRRYRHDRLGAQEEGHDPVEGEASQSDLALKVQNPEEIAMQNQRAEKIIEELSLLEEDDEEVQMVLMCIEDGVSKPREIAYQTGYDVKRVYNILRRIRRNLKKLLHDSQGEG